MIKSYLFAAFLFAALPLHAQEIVGDPDAGVRLFARCSSCHSVEDGQNGAGPHLFGLVGREVGSVEGFRYSSALADSTAVWDIRLLVAYFTAPRETLPGTRKTVSLRSEEQALDLVAYLLAQGG